MVTLDPTTLNQLLVEVTRAATAAAEASKATRPSTSTSADWSKLLSKPSNFDHKNLEEEIRYFKDWSWQLTQYVSAIDGGYTKELEDLSNDPTKPMDMSTASTSTRERGAKLYGLLAGLLRGRALQTLKAVGSGDGYEGWRQLLLTLRPTSKNRGLALMSAIMQWPQFQMNMALQPQILRLEDSFDEAKRSGVDIQEEVKVAVILKCLAGQLKTHVSLQLGEGMTYKELRECLMKWDRAQQRWQHLLPTSPDDPMHGDRPHRQRWQEGRERKEGSQRKGQGQQRSRERWESERKRKPVLCWWKVQGQEGRFERKELLG